MSDHDSRRWLSIEHSITEGPSARCQQVYNLILDAHHSPGKLTRSHNRKETGDEVQGVADIFSQGTITQPGIEDRCRQPRTECRDDGEYKHHGGSRERDSRTPLGEMVVQNRVHGTPTREQGEEGLAEEVVETAVKAFVSVGIGLPRCGEGAGARGDEDCEQEPKNGNVEEASDPLASHIEHCGVSKTSWSDFSNMDYRLGSS